MKKLTVSVCTAVLLGASAAVIAADQVDHMKDAACKEHMEAHLKMMDIDSDGLISKTEFMNHHTTMWDKRPKDANGMVRIEDMKMKHHGTMPNDGMHHDMDHKDP